mmetsp:Transcript_5710/g.4874  ORF Transcript_5710/g.4874 Transcript_5710/m.4874 type:complete len:85 (-) Transcript_5710:1095-1349(-)
MKMTAAIKNARQKLQPKIGEGSGGYRMSFHPQNIQRGSDALQELIITIPQVRALIEDMENNIDKWIEFINKSLISFKTPGSAMP